jgi:hypothetical protein
MSGPKILSALSTSEEQQGVLLMPPDWSRLTSEAFEGKPNRFIKVLASSAFFTSEEECLYLLAITEVKND